ncbi:unnamed protein product [Cylicocyclus nassatus]|uniref:Secreted protein n=1 Tax=Cylicocyclus nassatus TaxID=53992 RepID=A0AA36H758_CYLNA|nr:unnamed protein product [Cylicocyclus nassatus]
MMLFAVISTICILLNLIDNDVLTVKACHNRLHALVANVMLTFYRKELANWRTSRVIIRQRTCSGPKERQLRGKLRDSLSEEASVCGNTLQEELRRSIFVERKATTS